MTRIRNTNLNGLCAALCLLLAQAAWAHGGEDHGDQAPAQPALTAASSTAPQRLPDGSLWIPKPAQHRLGLRTVRTSTQNHPQAIELNGKVQPDPNAGGRVQTTQTGRLEAGPQGLPVLGQRVSKGQVLAYLHPAVTSVERGNQQATLAELDAQYALAERKLDRYTQLEGAIARKDIETARIERDALKRRRDAVRGSLNAPEPLLAPVSGIIASSGATLGQVIEAHDVVFEVVDPSRLMVEALAYDTSQLDGLSDATASAPNGASIALRFAGAGRQLRDQAMPVLFRVVQAQAPLAIGQTLKITAQTRQTLRGMAIPRAALQRLPSGDTMVWLHEQAERFTPHIVSTTPLNDATVIVLKGLQDGDRVVTEGANLLSQVR